MRIIRFLSPSGEAHFGEDRPTGGATVLEGSLLELVRTAQPAAVRKLLAPLIPTDIICIGRNYKSRTATVKAASAERLQATPHAMASQCEKDASGAPQPEDSTLEVFLKPSTALQNPHDPICTPNFGDLDVELDCEGELAVIIGREARNISESDALNHIFGYTIANDITARAFQTASGPPLWMRGKGFDTFCPIGPAIITADEIPDPQSLHLRTIINGEIVRDGNTRDMVRSVPQIIAALSRHMTLRAGAIVLTGAPPAHTTGGPLVRGAEVRVECSRIGCLENRVE